MVRHKAIGQNPHGPRFEGLGHHALEGFEIGVLEEQPRPSHASVQDVEEHAPRSQTCGSRHQLSLSWPHRSVNNWTCPEWHQLKPKRMGRNYLTMLA